MPYFEKTRHKIFISFYHADDSKYKEYISNYLCADLIDKSVKDGEYNPDDSDEYVKRLIREEKITDSSVIVVLIGPNTFKRKHVDWEIYAGLRKSLNGRSALIGILLPSYRMNDNNTFRYNDIPQRLADNVKTKYCSVYSWDYACKNFYEIVDNAFKNKKSIEDLADNSREQMKYNRS